MKLFKESKLDVFFENDNVFELLITRDNKPSVTPFVKFLKNLKKVVVFEVRTQDDNNGKESRFSNSLKVF